MNECRELEPLLAPCADGEAAGADRVRVDAHVEWCAGCRERLAAQRALRESLRVRRDGLRGCASEHLKARCAAAARTAASAGARPARPARLARLAMSRAAVRRWVPLTAAATILLAVAVVFGLGLNNKVQALAVQATIDHAKCTRLNMGGASPDPAAAAQAWYARFGWPITVPASSRGERLELRAVRRCAVTDGRVAHVMYQWNGEPLSLYVLPAPVVGTAPTRTRRLGHDTVMWSQNGRTYMLVASRRHDAALDTVAAYVRASAY